MITLHYCPDATGRPNKSNPQRRLFSEGRSGAGCDLVIDRTEGGTYREVMQFAQLEQQLQESKKQAKRSQELTETQQQLLELVDGAPNETFTRRQAVELLGFDWEEGRGNDSTRIKNSLNRLVGLGLIAKKARGRENVYFSHDAQNDTSPTSPTSPSSDTKSS